MTQIHKHRQSDLNRRDGGGGGGGGGSSAAGTKTTGTGAGGGKTKGNRNGLIESNLSVSDPCFHACQSRCVVDVPPVLSAIVLGELSLLLTNCMT